MGHEHDPFLAPNCRTPSLRTVAIGVTTALPVLSVTASRKPWLRTVALGLTTAFALLTPTVLAAIRNWHPSDRGAAVSRARGANGACGMSVAVVRRDKVLLARGFGEKNEVGDAVTSDTLFAIGSASKAFAALLIGQLVEQGKLSWTTPVTTLHPTSFKDPIAVSQANLIDISRIKRGSRCTDRWASSGTPPTRLCLWPSRPAWLIQLKVNQTQPSRSTWQYTNYMYALAGEIAWKAMGKASYAEALKGGLLDPLEMSSTVANFEKIPNTPDHARSIDLDGNVMGYEEEYFLSPTVAAGGISTSANDATHWLQTLLSRRNRSGTQLVNDSTFEQLTRPHNAIKFPRSAVRGYT
ncbi:beta-lactamase/transpeptidase-like protein [Blyttiomyces helicus]|uniref:Beta-lactamase/transpeptidase-like protein n=1 Tax=Blyttiomyces helicus TaxID=388810 RepID=A0A4P9VYF3_9FUNG|nr:beta-lactamase/transpeptidase-like protein [Blyttiomyces helicus]|eukprot:RKO84811.1 beta-lactamase/transpeptidase-like protein [Blyttiomyces helicus]